MPRCTEDLTFERLLGGILGLLAVFLCFVEGDLYLQVQMR